jgi:hypothetical protein
MVGLQARHEFIYIRFSKGPSLIDVANDGVPGIFQ